MAQNNKRGGLRRDPYFNQQPWRRRSSDNRKPPRGGGWQGGVPSWEKNFCQVAGSIDWHTFLDMKRFVHLFEDVVNWDDSAAEEAFHNAKNRFFAQMQGLPCDISTPDPNLYIDEVDWDSQVDPELLMDLESPYLVPDTSANDEPVLIFSDVLLQQKGFSPPGWGVIEEGNKDAANSYTGNQWPAVKPTGWGDDFDDDTWKQSLPKNGEPVKPTGWGSWEKSLPKSGEPAKANGWRDDFDDDPWDQGLPKSGEPVKATGWGDDFDDGPWDQGLPKGEEPVKATGWGDDFDDGRAAEAAEWPTIQENTWSLSHPKKQLNWRGDNDGAWGVKNGKKKQSSYWKNKTARFHGDGIGQNKAACF